MGLTEYIVKQAKKPRGKFGIFFARAMNSGHSNLTQWGLSHISIGRNFVILDIGCGGGKTINRLAGTAVDGKVYGIDYSEASVTAATGVNRKYIDTDRVAILHASVEAIPFSDNIFDLVTGIETCYFWPDMVNNLKEIKRVLKPGGSVILINESYKSAEFEKRNTSWAEAGDFTSYLPEDFEEFFKDAGYSPVTIDVLPDKNWMTATGIKK